ncbi:MAG: Acetyl esterase Axe7A precursor [Lentisphaerae bacterium ADurb.Bin242]|nr:MAG: Acetyl esterase Axe7A precursor [Lentisphaerae bacterium ADurb.Bin242]
MKKSIFAIALTMSALALAAVERLPVLSAQTDRPEAVYRIGEPVTFIFSVQRDGTAVKEGILEVAVSQDSREILLKKSFDLASQTPLQVEITGKKPGFLLLNAAFNGKTGAQGFNSVAAAGIEPEKIQAGSAPPPDLLDYWYGEYEKLKQEVPPEFEVEPAGESPFCKRYRITANHFGGTKIRAGLAIPKKGNGKYPLIVSVPPAGNWGIPFWEYPGAMRLTITVFDRIFDKDKNTYEAFNKDLWYFYKGADRGRENYYYYKSILGVLRMLDYIKTRPEWDGKNLIAVGRSQGGGFALIMAALEPKMTALAADVPALCDHHAEKKERRAGWPQLLSKVPGFDEPSRYYDAANFAAYIKCPAILCVGFIDTMCTPSSVYAAYNNLQGEKKIYHGPLTGHGWGEKKMEFQLLPLKEFIQSNIR